MALVCEGSTTSGDVKLGSGTIVHPFARIEAKSGSIIIGENNIIDENVHIVNE